MLVSAACCKVFLRLEAVCVKNFSTNWPEKTYRPKCVKWRKSVKRLQRYGFHISLAVRTMTTIPLHPEGWRSKNALFLLALHRLTHPLFTDKIRDRSGYGLSRWEAVCSVIPFLAGWAHTQNDLHNHSGYMDSINERQHYLKLCLILAGTQNDHCNL